MPDSNNSCVVCGDANFNTVVNDYISNEYLFPMSSKGLVPTIQSFTGFESQTCLDDILVTVG